MTRSRDFFLSDPEPENIQEPDDPEPENIQEPDDPEPENIQEPDDPEPENIQEPDDPEPENIQEPDDPEPENIQEPDDPEPENIQEPDDPDVAHALEVLQQRLGGSRPRRQRGGGRRSRPHRPVATRFEPEYSGNIVVRLAAHLDLEAARESEHLGKLASKLGLKGLRKVLTRHRLARASSRLVEFDEIETEAEAAERRQQKSLAKQILGKFVDRDDDDDGDGDGDRSSPRQPRSLAWLEEKAAASELPPLRSLESYWRLDVRPRPSGSRPVLGELRVNGWEPEREHEVDKILRQLNELDEVDRAYRELAASDPAPPTPHNDVYAGIQEHLGRAPLGIDANWASQQQAESLGAGVRLVDVEQGWLDPHHQDLPKLALGLIYGQNRHGQGTYEGHHGTAVLGEIIAKADQVGVVGIAPGAGPVGVASHFNVDRTAGGDVAGAIRQAISRLNPGDVLLLEVQRTNLPAEVEDEDFDAIRLAAAHGIIVVAAAGNGNANLDRYVDEDGHRILNRRSRHFRESGAIMVGAARADLPHNRYSGPVGTGSNYGSRIDCFAYGDRTVTTGYGSLSFDGGKDPANAYTARFGGTSAAAPIIAGAALVVQGMYQAQHDGRPEGSLPGFGGRLSPWEMRGVLADRTTGTRQGKGVAGRIGVMPDLRAILKQRLQLVPDLYLRDHLGDTGTVPTRRIGVSPDISVVAATARAKIDLGEKNEDAYVGIGPCTPGLEHRIFLRLRNRGGLAVAGPRASVFWSEVSTLVTPDQWHPISEDQDLELLDAKAVPPKTASEKAPPVTPGEKPAVGEISWKTQDDSRVAGAARHLTFVAIVEDPKDHKLVRPPSEPPYFNWNQFRAFLRQHNNVALRNVHEVAAFAAGGNVRLPFLLSGTPDLARRFDFEIVQRLPVAATVALEAPAALAPRLRWRRLWHKEVLKGGERLHLPARASVRFGRVRLVAGARFDCRFVVEGAVPSGHSLTIRQLYRGQEVGRIVWLFR